MIPQYDSIWTYEELLEEVGLPPEDYLPVTALLPDTPEPFREIVQYAAIWGISDDCYREDLISQASDRSIQNLKWVFKKFDDELELWLAGPESYQNPPTQAYVAFTSFVMAAL